MPAFLLPAGFFAQMVLMRKGPTTFLADRAVRIFGLLVTFCLPLAGLSEGCPLDLGPLWILSLICLLAAALGHVSSAAIWLGRARIDDLARRPVFGSLLIGGTYLFLTLDDPTPGTLGFISRPQSPP